jgi:cysteine-rich repeat protein
LPAWLHAPAPLVFVTLLSAHGMAALAAAVDLSGEYVVTVPIACRVTIVQTGTSFQTTGSCDFMGTPTPFSASGTVDPATGAFSGASDLGGVCPGVISGTGDGEVLIATATAPCYSGPISATKCGNGDIDPLENCEDGNQADGDCCSARCRLDAAGTACTGERNQCTDLVCDATGTCTHVPVLRPCDDGNACTVGDVCAGGACAPGAPAPAGVTCQDEFDPCTADVCDAAGACTHVPVPRAECRRAVACHSTCTQQLKACRRTCPASGAARRDCRTACAERSTCTAPGARIRTLAYVVSECTTDPQGRSSLKQKLVVRRGNCDPVTVMETDASTPVLDPLRACEFWGSARLGTSFIVAGVFQRMAVLPDGSGVIFEVTKQFSLQPSLAPELPRGEGIFFARADGREAPRRLGPASGFPTFLLEDPNDTLGRFYETTGPFSVDPSGRRIAFIDYGPATAGQAAPQIFLMDLRSGGRTQVTHQSQLERMLFATFLDGRRLAFFGGSYFRGTLEAFQVQTDGSGFNEAPAPPSTVGPGARVVPQFAVTGTRWQVFVAFFFDKLSVSIPAAGRLFVIELFLREGKNLVQLTNFGRGDTGSALASIARGRVFFAASANPVGENPAEICQVFSVNTRGGDLRQLTRLPSDGRPNFGCLNGPATKMCTIDRDHGVVADQVTGTLLFSSSCDPVGRNPFGDQLFAMRPDGSGLRQLTAARGRDILPDGTLRFEIVGPFAYALGRP